MLLQIYEKVEVLATEEVPVPNRIYVGKQGKITDTVDNWAYVEGVDFAVWYPMSALKPLKPEQSGLWTRTGS